MLPNHSVIVPLYNNGPNIARALDSILTQTYQDFEIIVVYRESNDDGAEIVNNYRDPRIRLLVQEGKGVAEGRNQGIAASSGELISFLDADDEWSPEHLETIMRLWERFPEAGAFVTSYIIHEEDGKVRRPILAGISPSPWEGLLPNYFLSATLGDDPVHTLSISIKRGVVSEVGAFPLGFTYGEDLDLWGRIAMRYPIAFSSLVGGIYHNNKNRISTRAITLEKAPFVDTGRNAVKGGEVPENMIPYVHEYVNRLELTRARWSLMKGDKAAAKGILIECETNLLRKERVKLVIMSLAPRWLFKALWKVRRTFLEKVFGVDYSGDPWLQTR